MIDQKANLRDLEKELISTKTQFEDLYLELNRKINTIPNERELEFLHSQLKDKVSRDEFREGLELKASKNMVVSSLNGKLDRIGIEELLGQKTDLGDLQRILAALESKVDYSMIEQIHAELQNKVDRSDFTHILLPEMGKKVEKYEIELLFKEVRSNFEKSFLEHSSTTDAYLSSFKADLEQLRRSVNSNLGKKIEAKDVERLYSLITKKADFDATVDLMEKVKSDFRDFANDIKRDLKKSEDFDFRYRLESDISKLKDQVSQIISEIRDDNDEKILFVKSYTNSLKSELQRDFNKVLEEVKFTQDSFSQLSKRQIDNQEFRA